MNHYNNSFTAEPIKILFSPEPDTLGASVEEFLHILGQACWITIPGKDRSRCRAISTLLHGNEPSGVIALHQWLKLGETPAVDIHLFFGSIEAALTKPLFSYRALPKERDLNRCFKFPFDDKQGAVAKKLLGLLLEFKPEALIDIHNTSGSGPSFAVAINGDEGHNALTSLFTQRLIITDLRLGALMELSESEDHVPTVTIECGGSMDEESHQIARDGIQRFIHQQDVMNYEKADWDVEVLHNPIRLELKDGAKIQYGDTLSDGFDLCLPEDIENHNFGIVHTKMALGKLGQKGLKALSAKTAAGEEKVAELFKEVNNTLMPAKALKLFMITTNPVIASNDCILYAIEI